MSGLSAAARCAVARVLWNAIHAPMTLGGEAVGHLMQVDGLVFRADPPQAFDEDVVQAPVPAWSMEIAICAPLSTLAELEAGKLTALSVLKISGRPYSASASLNASTQNPASTVFDSRHARTWRVAQSMIAIR